MAVLLNDEETINTTISPTEVINTNIPDINYIPGYKVAEEERRENEEERISNENAREEYINELKEEVASGAFDGKDGAIQYTAGTGIEITDENVINNTQTSAEWGNITGTLSDQSDLVTVLSDKANTSDIPTKVSDLTNDSGFIDSTVNNLTNYYTKSQTYNKSEIDSLIAQIPGFNVVVVQTLPVSDIDPHTIYLVPKTGSGSDIYDEYIYINNTWELIGNTQADLTNYYTKTETNTLLGNKQNTLVSGTNIKTINNASVLGSGNISVNENEVQISDTEPTDPNNKLWIDTGEVQSIGSEVSVGATQPTNGEKVWFKTSKNLFDYSKSINGYISATGEFNTSNANMLSDYIETESNKQYIASTYTNVYGINIAEFDSSKAFIKRTMSSSNVKENSITTSSTTKYIRVWFNIDNSTTMNINSLTNIKAQILYGDIATTYEPYINKQIYTNQNGYYNEFYSENNTTKYSTNEIRIGTWIDGKPLYRKVVTATINHPASTTTVETYEINHNISNAQSIFIDYGTTYSNGNSIMNTFYNVSQGKFTYWSRARIDINKIYYDLYYNSYSIDTENLIITILYTKTTD